MYPTAFPREQWYVAGHGRDAGRELTCRWILGDPVCLYRTRDGRPVALVDRCVHRQMPLSMGRLKGDEVECGYHGILYGEDGRALRIPGQQNVPPACRVHRYPIEERGGLLWIWMGDPGRADQALIPAIPWLDADGWTAVRGTLHVNARAQLMNENLLDLSHVTFLHPETIGTGEVAETPVSTEFDEGSVRVRRSMSAIQCPPLFEKVMGLIGLIDRDQVAEFIAPGLHITHVTARPAGAAADDPRTCQHKAIHCITPEKDKSAHYFWALARDYNTGSAEVSELWAAGTPQVFAQDIAAAEAIENVISAYEPRYPVELNMKVDAGPLRARRLIERMVRAEENERPTAGAQSG